MIKRFFILLLAIVASVGMSYALTPLSGDSWDNTTKILTVNSDPGKNGYKDNTEIEHVVITDGVTSLANGAFYGCTSLTSVTLPSGLTTIGNDAFRETSLASVSLPSGLISIGNNAFNQCTALASVTFPEGFETIGIGAFSGCSSLTSVTLPESLTTVNVGVFSGCTSLASVTILAPSLSTYGKSVFYDTASGLKIYVPYTSVNTYKTGWSTYADKITAIPGTEPAPAKLPGAFTINADGDKIVFSKGNLQATTTDLGANWTWDFAPNQWSLIGNAVANNAINGNKKVSSNGTVDLFGWSTAATYYGINNSWKNDDYTGDFVDWGALMGTEWRTLSRAEFYYIVYSRTDAYKKRGQATVNGVPGYVLLPDAWTLPSGLSFTNSIENYTTNQYDGADWTAMESAGAVFLPAAGVREGTDIYQVNLYGWYWASTPNETDGGKAYYLYFDKSSQGVTEYNRWKSKSVRLVTEAPIPAYEAAIKLINAIGTVELTAECKAKIDTARTAYDALSTEDKALVTNYTTLTTAEAAFENVMNIWLSGDCDAILWKDTTLTVRKHAGEGNGAMADYTSYYGSNTAPWYNSHWYNPQPGDIVIKSVTIEEGVTHIGENAFGWMSELKTVTIPSSMTSIGEDAFYWSKAVDDIYLTVADPANLTWILPYSADNQFKPEKATLCHVPADLLTAYQENFGTLNMTFVGDLDPATPLTPEQQQALDAVKGLINAIPSPVVYTPACKDAIDAARAAYDALTPDMLKQLVSNYATLTAAETTYANLKDVAVAEAKINNIPTPVELKLATRDSIESARAAYEALNADQKLLVSNIDVLTAAEAELATLNPGGGAPAGALNGKFTINADGDQIAFAKGNLQATTTDLGENWTWGFAANQWDLIGNAAANNAVTGNRTVSANGTVDLFGWSTPTTYYGIHNSTNSDYYSSDFREWGENITGATWKTLRPSDWIYIISNRADAAQKQGQATVNGVNGYIFLPDEWELPSGLSFTAKPNNWTANVYDGDDWTAMENAGAVFLPKSPWRSGNTVNTLTAGYYWSSDYNSYSQAMAYSFQEDASIKGTGINRFAGIPVRLVTADAGSPTPLDSAQAVKDLIEAIPVPVTLDDACVNAVQAARDAYNALAEATKGALDDATVQKLNQAITDYTALIQAGADAVKAKIAAIPQPVTLKLATRDSIESARAAYDALTADQKALVTNYAILEAAEAALAALNPGGGAPAGALNGKFTINAGGDQIAFSKGNLQATTTDLGAHWTWGFAANQWNYLGIAVANNKITGNKTVSENGTVDLFGWSTAATYYGINNSYKAVDYIGDFVDWGPNMGAGWRTLTKDEWAYLLQHSSNGKATVNDKNGYIFLPDNWSGPAFTPNPDNFTTNVYSGDDWTAMENAGAVFLPSGPARNGTYALIANDAKYCSSTSLNNDSSYVFTIYYNQSQSACTGTNRAYGCMVRLVSEGGGATPLDSAQAIKDLIEAIPTPVTLEDACVKAIEDARAAYDALSEATKGALDAADVQKLTDAEAALTALNQAEADKVIAKINNIPLPVELKLATRDSIQNARAAYDALTAAQQDLVTNYQTLLNAEAALAEKNKGGSTPVDIVWDGNTGIENVSPTTTSPAYEGMTVTVGKGSSFSTYQSRLYFTFNSQPNGGFIFANENGTNITKVVIESTTALTSTMTEVDRMGSGWVISNENKTATWTGNTDSVSIWKGQSFTNYWVVDKITFTVNGVGATPLDSAQAVKDLIDAIPTPVEYPTSGPAIAAALVAYNQLSDAAKGALDASDVQKMTDAAIQYAALDAIAAIEAIPAEIVYDPAVKAAIETAREKYDALIDASKALVDDEVVAKLTNAEQAWADLVALIEHTVTYIGKDGELKNEKVALLHIPNPAPDFNGHEFVRWDVKAGDFLEEGLRIKAVYTPIITTQPVAYDTLVYNGTAQTLIEAGVASDGHIEYRLNEGDWSAELPKADMAAAYVVDYKLVREGHEDYMAGSVNAVIAKAPVTYVAPQAYDTLAYNYNTQVLVTAGQTNDGTIEYSLDPNLLDSWSADLPQAMNAGTYAVNYRVIGDANHFDSIVPAPVTVTIAKRDIEVTAPVAYDALVYNALAQTLAAAGSADFSMMEYTLTPDNGEGWSADMPQAMNAGTYAIYYRVQGDNNHNDYPAHSIAATIAQAPLTITAENKEVIYGDAAPEFTATYSGWMGQDDATVISNLQITSTYAAGSSVGTYAIVPSGATALNYTMSYVNGSLTVNKAKVSVINAEAQKAKFADGHAVAVVLNQGTLDGVKLNDAVTHVTTAAFSSAEVSEQLTITLFYELTGDAALLANYDLQPTSEVFTTEGVIIEPFLPNNDDDPEDKESKVQEGIEVYAYGYCKGDSVGLKYHLNSGNPDQYMIEFEDSRFTDADWTLLDEKGPEGVIYITVPVDVPTGDYKMTVTFRDSRFAWLESQPLSVTFHVNLSETYVRPLFDNTIVLVDTCECFTDIQWYHRADATEIWQPVPGANGHYLHVDGKLEGEYFVAAKMNGEPTYTCGQVDMVTLYGAGESKQAKVSAYPNPVVTTTTVSIENSDNYEHNLRIVNLMGIEVMNTTFEGNETVVDMDSYTTGNYTISVDGIVVKVLKK